jgi:hypothetical protein
VAISLTMSNIVRLRILNLLGAITFAVYGVLITAWPVAFMNTLIVFINIYYLLQMRNTKEYLKLVTTSADDEYLNYVLSFHREAIAANQPEFQFNPSPDDVCALVLRDTVPAGLFIGSPSASGEMIVKLDFVPPAYRDFKIGAFLFSEKRGFFQALAVSSLRAQPGDAEHAGYLLKMGFEPQADGTYLKRL